MQATILSMNRHVVKAEGGSGYELVPSDSTCLPVRVFYAFCDHRLGAERAWIWGPHIPLEGSWGPYVSLEGLWGPHIPLEGL